MVFRFDFMKRNRQGFTIIELLIVVGVIGVISTLVVVSFTSTKRGMVLDQTKDYVSADISKVITWAQAGKIDISTGSRVVPNGYGIVFWLPAAGLGDYYIYADDPVSADKIYTPLDTIIEEVDLSEALSLSELFVDDVQITDCDPHPAGMGGPSVLCNIFVDMPSGELYVNSITQTDMTVVLENVNTGTQYQITINIHSGQVDFIEL